MSQHSQKIKRNEHSSLTRHSFLLVQWFLTRSINVSWKLVRNSHSQASEAACQHHSDKSPQEKCSASQEKPSAHQDAFLEPGSCHRALEQSCSHESWSSWTSGQPYTQACRVREHPEREGNGDQGLYWIQPRLDPGSWLELSPEEALRKMWGSYFKAQELWSLWGPKRGAVEGMGSLTCQGLRTIMLLASVCTACPNCQLELATTAPGPVFGASTGPSIASFMWEDLRKIC